MLESLLLHPKTRANLQAIADKSAHGIILQGPAGSGKETTAKAMATLMLGLESLEKLSNYPYATVINPATTTITIDEIRAAQNLLVLKVPAHSGSTSIRRVIIVIDAERMRTEAQNAFLKTLEEPPLDTCIILTASSKKLLPTITSRAQSVAILPISESQATEYFGKQGVSSQVLHKNYALSQGQAGLLSALLSNEEHMLAPWVQTAKEVLSEPAANRLLRVEALSKDKDGVRLLLDSLSRIAHSALTAAAQANKQAAVDRWVGTQAAIQDSVKALSYNASVKLVLDNLFIHL